MNVLIVDDNVATGTLIAAHLKKINPLVKITFAITEMQALDYVEVGKFHLVMVDVDLGNRAKGLELIPKLEQFQREAKLVLLIVSQDTKITERAKEIGLPCLSKPVDPRKLKEFLSRSTV
jgi:response regulator of citrate/malate metabolism